MKFPRKTGFTLVELLVVMAIIAILASIVVPNVISYIKSSRATKALAEVKNIEMALGKMLADANRHSLTEFFKVDVVAAQANGDFEREIEIYTRTLYALLRQGRLTIGDTDPGTQSVGNYSNYLNETVIQKLGTNYMDVQLDPWDQLYNIYPGPWTALRNRDASGNLDPATGQPRLIPFRTYLNPAATDNPLPGTRGSAQDDLLTVDVQDLANEDVPEVRVGYSAPTEKPFYIWSSGENAVNDQALNAVTGVTGRSAYKNPDELFFGGGDDINNWDNGASWGRFYN